MPPCSVSSAQWARITETMALPNPYANFSMPGPQSECDVNNAASLVTVWTSCTRTTLGAAVAALPGAPSCTSDLTDSLTRAAAATAAAANAAGAATAGATMAPTPSSNTISAAASQMCGRSLQDFAAAVMCWPFNDASCPQGTDILTYVPMSKCFSSVFNATAAQASAFFSSGQDKACIYNDATLCTILTRTGGSCPGKMQDMFDYLDQNHVYTCQQLFPTVLERCSWTLAQVAAFYCPPRTLWEQYQLPIILGSSGAFAILLLCLFFWKRIYKPHFITAEELVASHSPIVMLGKSPSSPTFEVHPELPEALATLQRKYKGAVKFDPVTRRYLYGSEAFQTEKEAAKAAYLATASRAFPKSPLLSPAASSPSLTSATSPSFSRTMSPSPSDSAWGRKQPMAPLSLDELEGGAGGGLGNMGALGGSMGRSMGGSMGGSSNTLTRRAAGGAPGSSADTAGMGGVGSPGATSGAASADPAERREYRKRQLIEFYEFWDAERTDIPAHVEHLLARHRLQHIARALMSRYGVVPPGWDRILVGDEDSD